MIWKGGGFTHSIFTKVIACSRFHIQVSGTQNHSLKLFLATVQRPPTEMKRFLSASHWWILFVKSALGTYRNRWS